MLGKRKDSFIEEASNSGEKVDSCPKEPIIHSPGFAQRLYREKRKGLHAREGVKFILSEMIVSIMWFQVAIMSRL